MVKKVEGCVHLILRKGKIVNVFTHLNKMPKEGVKYILKYIKLFKLFVLIKYIN